MTNSEDDFLAELANKASNMACYDAKSVEAMDFDAIRWVTEWIQRSQPALAGSRPIDLMATPAGRESVIRVLEAAASGVYL